MDKTIEHLKLIQGVINRMARNSFLLKGWSVVIVSALFAIAASNTDVLLVCIAYLPVVAFWTLDGYFLRQEKLFRKLYDHVRGMNASEIDYSMDTSIVKNQVASWVRIAFSRTLLIFHGTVFTSVVIVMGIIILLNKGGC